MKDLERFSGKTGEKKAPATPAQVLPQAQFVTITEEEAGQRIDNYLLRVCKGVPKSHIYRILRSGEVRVNKGRIDQLYRLNQGDVVRSMGLRRIRHTVELKDTPETRGLIHKVRHLVEVTD